MSKYVILHDYQVAARKTAIYPGMGGIMGLAYTALGAANEAGEIAGEVKKMIRDDHCNLTPERQEKISNEIGDTLWYLANVATEAGLDFDLIATQNLKRLEDRAERGVIQGSGGDR